MSWHPNDLLTDADLVAYESTILTQFARLDWQDRRQRVLEDWLWPILRGRGLNPEQFRTRYAPEGAYGYTGSVHTDVLTHGGGGGGDGNRGAGVAMALPAERLEVLGVYRVAQYDPTRTLTLRNAFASKMVGKFRKLAAAINKAVVERDCFGLMGASLLTQADPVLPARGQFAFPRSADKVAAFMAWLRRQENDGILETRWMPQLGTSIEQSWMNLYLFDTYQRAVMRARYELVHAGYPVPSIRGQRRRSASTSCSVRRFGLPPWGPGRVRRACQNW